MADLIQTVMGALPAGATSTIASLIGESPTATTAGITAALPALLAGAVQKSSTASGANDLVNQLRQITAGGNPLDRFGSILSDPSACFHPRLDFRPLQCPERGSVNQDRTAPGASARSVAPSASNSPSTEK